MSTEVVVLKDGYSRKVNNNIMKANGTCSLVKSFNHLILVDTLGPWNANELKNLINKQGYDLKDIDFVVCTHQHPDHLGNLNLFTHSKLDADKSSCIKHIVGNCAYSVDEYELNVFENDKLTINSNLEIVCTPGHTFSCVSIIVKNVNNKGTVALVGDLFENKFDLKNDQIWIDAGSENQSLQKKNRQFIMNTVDYIVPGHGEMFKIKDYK